MSVIFISYRQDDCAPQARALFERLRQHHPDQVFFDASEVMGGDEFASKIQAHLNQCRVLLALIGPDWLNTRNDAGQRRLDDEQDWVRCEISMALRRGIRVIPVLVDKTPKPEKKYLPPDLHALVDRQWVNLNVRNGFDQGVGDLIRAIQAEIPSVSSPENSAPDVVRPSKTPPSPTLTHKKIQPPSLYRQDPRMRWASDFDVDAKGNWVWADLRVGTAMQRLRWIQPGSFMMGDKEAGPAHRVRITKGFWMADTACTEMFWSAVTESPVEKASGDAQNPVRYISWQSIQEKFMYGLNRRLTAIEAPVVANFPSEAQWEYACRAGGQKDFSFEKIVNTPTRKNVNCDGWHGGVVVVKHLPANASGLHQMHGNVWEWCRDAHRAYVMDAGQTGLSDPLGSEDGYTSVLKGGSWRDPVWQARSAARRCGVLRGHLGDDVGFRFLLESCG